MTEPVSPISTGEDGRLAASSIDWPQRQSSPVRRILNRLERVSLAAEKPIVRLVREPHWNPLYHTGTITLFALVIIVLTGVYLTLFLQFGFAETYQAIARIDANFLGRTMRALHRYASVLALIGALLHGWRTLFMDRFRGPRWLAWVTGILLMALVWAAGLTGYWLLFDERAALFNQWLVDQLARFGAGVTFLNRFLLTEAAGNGWLFVLGILTVHIGLTVIIAAFFLIHIKRLRRPKILPPRFWMALLAGPLILAALLVPVGLLPPLDPGQTPAEIPLDLFMLWYLPAALRLPTAIFWGAVALTLTALSLLPWLLRRKPLAPVVIHADRCTGCTLCATDCPYRAISMASRADGSQHQLLAVLNPALCVSCGVCIGSCPPLAITLGDQPAEPLWQQTVQRAARRSDQPVHVVFTCERHAQQSARGFLSPPEAAYFPGNGQQSAAPDNTHIELVPLTCVGMAHPDLAAQALEAGATVVRFIGCPPEDCANREGNLWLEERLERRRLPRLRRDLAGTAAVASAWQAPNDFPRALSGGVDTRPASAYAYQPTRGSWRSAVPTFGLLAVTMILVVLSTMVPYRPPGAEHAMIEINLRHQSGRPLVAAGSENMLAGEAQPGSSDPMRLVVEINSETVLEKTYTPRSPDAPIQAVEQVRLPEGEQQVRVLFFERSGQAAPEVLLEQAVRLEAGQTLQLAFHDARLSADPRAGEKLFKESAVGANAGCTICHSLQPGVTLVGPSLAGVAARAAMRSPDRAPAEYLKQSIVSPDALVVDGFPAGQMPPNYADHLSAQQIDDLVAFLLTLE